MLSPAPAIQHFAAPDGYPLTFRRWSPSTPAPIGHVVILHGIISHSGWYLKTGAGLARAGLAVHSLDRRGSGLNSRGRGDVDHFTTWVDDVTSFIESLEGGWPVIVAGISWGGLLAMTVARRRPEFIDGVALLCPGFFSRKGTSSLQHKAVRIASRCGMAGARFPVPLRDPVLFTDSPWWRTYIRDDPFTLRKVTLRLATASADLYAETIHSDSPVTQPALLMLAGQDLLIQNDQVRAFVDRVVTGEKRIVEYPDSHHTLEFDTDPSRYLNDLADWCTATVTGAWERRTHLR